MRNEVCEKLRGESCRAELNGPVYCSYLPNLGVHVISSLLFNEYFKGRNCRGKKLSRELTVAR